MVTEIVCFDLPPGTTRAAALALYWQSASQWVANPDLVEKYYFFDEVACVGGGVYFWRTREAMARWHDAAYMARAQALYGTPPRIQCFDTLLHVDPVRGVVAVV